MSERSLTFYNVGKGNCIVAKSDEVTLVFDIHYSDGKDPFQLLKHSLRQEGGVYIIDGLFISHGDQDHCGGFEVLREAQKKGELKIGVIFHPNYDRTKVTDDLPECYKQLHAEILDRRKNGNTKFGNYEVPLTAWDTEEKIFDHFPIKPSNTKMKVLCPYLKDDGKEEEWSVNDICLVINLDSAGLNFLLPGDSGSEIWQERIIPKTLKQTDKKDWAKAEILIASHHGSFSFFGKERDEVRDADPYPDNYEALDYIKPDYLVISAPSKFPTSRDFKGDQPPHYAAYKWYKKWFIENKKIKDKEHPDEFKYTCDGHVRLTNDGAGWKWDDDWTPPEGDGGSGKQGKGFEHVGSNVNRDRDRYA